MIPNLQYLTTEVMMALIFLALEAFLFWNLGTLLSACAGKLRYMPWGIFLIIPCFASSIVSRLFSISFILFFFWVQMVVWGILPQEIATFFTQNLGWVLLIAVLLAIVAAAGEMSEESVDECDAAIINFKEGVDNTIKRVSYHAYSHK